MSEEFDLHSRKARPGSRSHHKYVYEYMYMSPLICKSIITLLARLERVEIIVILKISTGFPHFGTRLAIQRDI